MCKCKGNQKSEIPAYSKTGKISKFKILHFQESWYFANMRFFFFFTLHKGLQSKRKKNIPVHENHTKIFDFTVFCKTPLTKN